MSVQMGMKTKLTQKWQERCRLIRHEKGSVVFEPTIVSQMHKVSPCFKSGHCSCGELEGRWRQYSERFLAKLIKFFKNHFWSKDKGKNKSEARILLEQARIVICFASEIDAQDLYFFHIGDTNFSTWKMGWTPLLPVDEQTTQDHFNGPVQLQHTSMMVEENGGFRVDDFFWSPFEAIGELDLREQFTVWAFQIDEADSLLPIQEMKPGLVQVSALKSVPPSKNLWLGAPVEEVALMLEKQPRQDTKKQQRQTAAKPKAKEQKTSQEDGTDADLLHILDQVDSGHDEDPTVVQALEDVGSTESANTALRDNGQDLEDLDGIIKDDDVSDSEEFEESGDSDNESPKQSDTGDVGANEDQQNFEEIEDEWVGWGGDENAQHVSQASQGEQHDQQQEQQDDVPDALHEVGLAWSRKPGVFEQRFFVPRYGEIRYNSSQQFIRAHCSNPAHGSTCLRRRISTASSASTAKARGQGRPIGLLLSWLKEGAACRDKSEHMSMPVPSHETRAVARTDFLKVAGAQDFSNMSERALRANEEEEPRFIS